MLSRVSIRDTQTTRFPAINAQLAGDRAIVAINQPMGPAPHISACISVRVNTLGTARSFIEPFGNLIQGGLIVILIWPF